MMSNYLRKRNDLGFFDDGFFHNFFDYSPLTRGYEDMMKTDVLEKENRIREEIKRGSTLGQTAYLQKWDVRK